VSRRQRPDGAPRRSGASLPPLGHPPLPRHRWHPLRALLALAVVLGVIAPVAATGTPSALAATVADFDWTMPERFGPDRNGDGLIDYVDGATDQGPTGYDTTPDRWRVDLDACLTQAGPEATYAWRIVDQPDAAAPIAVQGGPGCGDFWMEVPEEGAYRVDLVVTDADGTQATVRKEVVVQDWLIISVGDSYGSGEGVPDVAIDQTELAEAEAAWAAVEDAWEALWTVEADMAPVQAAIARWQQAIDDAAHYCDLTAEWGDAGRCAEALGSIVVESALVVAALAGYAGEAVIDSIDDAVSLVATTIANAEDIVEGAIQLADSITGRLSATWQEDRCHRSAKAGSALAAKQIEDADPRTSVTFVHLACSGATMAYGLLGWYEGTEPAVDPSNPDEHLTNVKCDAEGQPAGWVRPEGCIEPQVDVAKRLAGGREVDAAYVSIGGNDAHFADIVISCILLEPCEDDQLLSDLGPIAADTFCPPLDLVPLVGSLLSAGCDGLLRPIDLTQTAAQLIDEGILGDTTAPIDKRFPGLDVGYGRLAAALTGGDAPLLPAQDAERVFLSEYVDAVKADDGTLCDWDSMGFASIPGLSAEESAYIDAQIVPRLTAAIEGATETHGWTFVDGVYAGFTNHGYCAEDHYLVRLTETFQLEGRYHGMVHPNYAGHRVYRDAIHAKLQPSLYPTGDVAAPRRPDQAAFADAGGPWTVAEGSSLDLTHESWDSDGDPMAFSWTHDRPGSVSIERPTSAAPVLHGLDDAAGELAVQVSDEDGTRSDRAAVTVTNVAPTIGDVVGLLDPILVGSSALVTVPFGDAGAQDTHDVTIDWGDGSTSQATVEESAGVGQGRASHAYAAPGIYIVRVTVTDDDGGSASTEHYGIAYDPAGGFATGGGWFESPSGAYTPSDDSDPDVTGKAHFAFVSKYQKGAKVPEGNTSFRFTAGDLQLESVAYEWMVVSGTKVTYKGTARVNGIDGYAFTLSAVDGGNSGDKLRIKIWDRADGGVLYDNQAGDALEAAARTVIDAGQITVRGPK